MLEYKYRCMPCKMMVNSETVVPSKKLVGDCPKMENGNHYWVRI